MARIDTTQQLALVEPEGKGMVGLPAFPVPMRVSVGPR